MSTVGRLALSGDGAMVLASCYTLGIQRFDLRGRNEGSYHLGGTVSHAVPDFPGRTIAAATLEGELAIMNSGGNVRWRTTLARPAIALEIDPLGRYVIYGHATGEVVRLDLFAGMSPRGPSRQARAHRGGPLRRGLAVIGRRRARSQLDGSGFRDRSTGRVGRDRGGRGTPHDRDLHQPAARAPVRHDRPEAGPAAGPLRRRQAARARSQDGWLRRRIARSWSATCGTTIIVAWTSASSS